MFPLSPATRVFLRPGVTDMRKGYDGLFSLTRQGLGLDPRSGHLFLFCNRGRNRLKILFWDGSGLWICAKRLERGRFSWPASGEATVELSSGQLTLLLDGIELRQAQPKSWYRRGNPASDSV
jgi:transposase